MGQHCANDYTGRIAAIAVQYEAACEAPLVYRFESLSPSRRFPLCFNGLQQGDFHSPTAPLTEPIILRSTSLREPARQALLALLTVGASRTSADARTTWRNVAEREAANHPMVTSSGLG